MVSKGNAKSTTSLSLDELALRVDAARASYNRHRDAAAEAVGYVYLLYRDTRSGDAKKWIDGEIATSNGKINKANDEFDFRLQRAKDWRDKKLSKNDQLNLENPDAAQKAANEKTIIDLQALLDMSSPDRAKLRLVPAVARQDSSIYMLIVRYVLGFDRPTHAAMVSRYCLVMQWIAAQFDQEANVEVDQIKAAIEAESGFDCCVEIQRRVNEDGDAATSESDEALILKAQSDDARAVVNGMRARTTIQMHANKAKDGYVLLLGRTNGADLDILGEADVGDNELKRMITRLGDDNMIGASSEMEFIGRVMDLGATIREKQEVPSMADPTKKVTTERMVSLKSDENGAPQLVVSVNRADACAILHASPKVADILTMIKGDCVLQSNVRRRLEREVSSRGRRRLLTVKVNTAPTSTEGKATESPLSWEIHNKALADEGRSTANQTFFWTALSSIGAKPLDVDHFSPEFRGTLDQSDIVLLNTHLLSAWRASKSSTKNRDPFLIELKGQELTLTCGDADPLKLELKTRHVGKLVMRFRISDIDALINEIADQHCVYELAGDTSGLLKISWTEDSGAYDYFIPTLGMDGRLMSRRVAPMRPSPTASAAE